jgi:hypothetical protein
VGRYLRNTVALDAAVALASGLLALRGRYNTHGHVPTAYVVLTAVLPVIWVAALALAGAYEARFIGAGADEFRRVINAGLGLTSAIAVLSYLTKAQVSRSYRRGGRGPRARRAQGRGLGGPRGGRRHGGRAGLP